MKIFPRTATATPAISASAKPVEAISEASFFLPAPSILERKFPEPWPNKKPSAWMTAIIGKTMPTAAVACVGFTGIRPTKYVSAVL